MTAIIRVFLAALCLSCLLSAQDKIEPPTFQKRVEPEYPATLKSFLIEPARFELIIDQEGVPFSVKSATTLPDNVVDAVSKWRFRPAKKNGTSVGWKLSILVPIHRPLADMIGRMSRAEVSPRVIADPLAAAKKLDAAGAARLEEAIKSNPADIAGRLTLLMFAKTENSYEARQMRLRQILWLAANQPRHEILGAPYAILTEPTAAESRLYEQIRQLWLKAMAQYAADPIILEHATNFLRFSDPEIVERTVEGLVVETDRAAVFLGELYGLAALGATRVDPESGRVVGASEKMAGTPFAAKARTLLEKVDQMSDSRALFSALHIVAGAGFGLAKTSQVPPGYLDFCGRLLAHAKEQYPLTNETCDVNAPPPGSPESLRIGGSVQAANLTRPVKPLYPREAKARRIAGTVSLQAIIGKDGHVRNLELLSGPLALYDASRDAVLLWEYRPVKLNGAPVDVITTIEVTFSLN